MNLYTINTGYFKLDGGAMFGVVPKSIWNKINPADENNMCRWALRSLLIEDDNKLILIDNGIGNKQDEKFFNHYFLHGNETLDNSLKNYGYNRDDITDVILTHLHFDHCGGSVVREGDKLVPAFKNAVYWSNKKHWQWATNPNDREKASFLKENILPIEQSGQLKFIMNAEASGSELAEAYFSKNITLRFVHGHTQSMMLPQISYNGKTIVYMADLLPSTGHIPVPYIMGYDMFPLTTLNEKKSFLTEAESKNFILFFEHDPVVECCDLKVTEKGVRVNNTFSLQEV